jgi:hypothetical protein
LIDTLKQKNHVDAIAVVCCQNTVLNVALDNIHTNYACNKFARMLFQKVFVLILAIIRIKPEALPVINRHKELGTVEAILMFLILKANPKVVMLVLLGPLIIKKFTMDVNKLTPKEIC